MRPYSVGKIIMINSIVFDMDGTIADLYGLPNWLERLRDSDPNAYLECSPLVDMEQLDNLIARYQAQGVAVEVVSWGAMGGSNDYLASTAIAKRQWLKRHLKSRLNAVYVVPYGTPKHSVVADSASSILVDDNKSVRDQWSGETLDATNSKGMMDALAHLIHQLEQKAAQHGND